MNIPRTTKPPRGLTLIELLIVIGVIAVLVGLLIPAGGYDHKGKAMRAYCQNSLKQIGFASRTWAADHNHQFPMLISTNAGGSLEWAAGADVVRHFQAISNEINDPKYLVCPSDTRKPATDFASLKNINLSYFLGLDADETMPSMWLAGDRNLVTNGIDVNPGLAVISTNAVVGWSQKMHNQAGNIVLADGSVQQTSELSLRSLFQSTGTNVTRLAVP